MYDSDDPIAVSGTLALHSFRLWPLRSIVAVTIAAFSFDLRLFHQRHFGSLSLARDSPPRALRLMRVDAHTRFSFTCTSTNAS